MELRRISETYRDVFLAQTVSLVPPLVLERSEHPETRCKGIRNMEKARFPVADTELVGNLYGDGNSG